MNNMQAFSRKFMRSNCWNFNYVVKRAFGSKVIGIDLGTTNSAVAYIRDSANKENAAAIIENSEGKRTTPSVVAFDKVTGKPIIGAAARRQASLNSQNTFSATKRLIGRKFLDDEVTKDIDRVPYKIIKSVSNDQAYLQTTRGDIMSPSEIASYILKHLKGSAESYLEMTINKAIITVPAYFNDSQRQATKDAGKLAGLEVLRVVNEPTAAALSFGLNNKSKSGIIAVYDLGGGTFDISILDIEDGVFEVRATNGDTHLGGEDFDNVLVDYIIDQLVSKYPQEITRDSVIRDREAVQRIREAAEKAKIELSHVKSTIIKLPFIVDNRSLEVPLEEEQLDDMTLHLINQTIEPVRKALSDADIEPEDVDEVILVGGMTRMPKIRSIVEQTFKRKPNHRVNPDETVALGAAIQGGILSGEIENVLLLDVTPLTLGIETFGGAFAPLIPRNTTLPVKKTEVFSTGVDGQTSVDIKVYQGERGLVRNNKIIGDLKLTGIPPMVKGTPQIMVTFDINADGILNVSAMEKSSNQESSIQVVAKSGLTEEEISKLVEEAEANKEHDNLIKSRLELVAKADIMVSDSLHILEKFAKAVSSIPEYDQINASLKGLKAEIEVFKADENNTTIDVSEIKRKTDRLQHETLRMFQKISKKVSN